MNRPDILTKILLVMLIIGVWGLLIQSIIQWPGVQAQTKSEKESAVDTAQILKARGLIIVDEQGRERIFIGSPAPDSKEGKRINPLTGITINDPAGFERFGVGLMDNGNMILGLDAPPGTGDDRNRERLHLVADSEGGALLRFLNKKTQVPGWLRLGDDDNLYLEFLKFQPDKKKIITRRIGFSGQEELEEEMQ